MIQRLVGAAIFVLIALCALWAVSRWGGDPHPLIVEAAAPIAIPHEQMLFSPCPLAPRNVPPLKRRLA